MKDSGEKACICLFTCAVTRAVHKELVCHMTTERFLLALRRMIPRRGMCAAFFGQIMQEFSRLLKGVTEMLESIGIRPDIDCFV